MNVTYLGYEVRRVLRSRRALFLSVALPVVLFLLIDHSYGTGQLDGLSGRDYFLVSMATYGILTSVIAMAGRIAVERSAGWNRQLRLTSLTGPQYVATKVLTGFAIGIPGLLMVLAAGALTGTRLPGDRTFWVIVSILGGMLPLASLGVWVGYVARSDQIQQILGLLITGVALLGGLYVPLTSFPHWLRVTVKLTPFPWGAQAGREAAVGHWMGWHGLLVVVVWIVLFGAGAGRAYLHDTERV